MSDAHSDTIVGDDCTQNYHRMDGSGADEIWGAVEAVGVDALLELPDAFFEVFAVAPRRRAVAILREVGRPLPVGELALLVAADLHGTDVGSVTADQRKRTAIELHHVHLPKLDEWGLVGWDWDDGTVVLLDGSR